MNRGALLCATLLAAIFAAAPAVAAEIRVAVAANFIEPVKEIGVLFARATGHEAVFSSGGTGQLYAQITQEAPFEVFLAADQATAKRAVDEGFAVAGSRFTYATGRLALFSRDPALVQGEATLRDGRFTKLAIANPATAPYGAAAVEVMKALGVYDGLAGSPPGSCRATTLPRPISSSRLPTPSSASWRCPRSPARRRGRAGSCPTRCTRRSPRTRCCSSAARTARPRARSSPSSGARRVAPSLRSLAMALPTDLWNTRP